MAYPTWWQARLRTLYAATEMGIYLDEYDCRSCAGWHVYGISKEVAHQIAYGIASNGEPAHAAELIARGRWLKLLAGRGAQVQDVPAQLGGPSRGSPNGQHAAPGAPAPGKGADLAARREALQQLKRLNRALAVALLRVHGEERTHRYRRKRRVPQGRFGRRQPRPHLPRGAAVTYSNGKMMARYDPAKKVWGEWSDLTGKLQPRDAPVIRRLHRHRERQMVRDLIDEELGYVYPLEDE